MPGTVECLSITIIDDGVTEGDESFTVGISSDSEEISVYPYSNQVIQIEGMATAQPNIAGQKVEIVLISYFKPTVPYYYIIVVRTATPCGSGWPHTIAWSLLSYCFMF